MLHRSTSKLRRPCESRMWCNSSVTARVCRERRRNDTPGLPQCHLVRNEADYRATLLLMLRTNPHMFHFQLLTLVHTLDTCLFRLFKATQSNNPTHGNPDINVTLPGCPASMIYQTSTTDKQPLKLRISNKPLKQKHDRKTRSVLLVPVRKFTEAIRPTERKTGNKPVFFASARPKFGPVCSDLPEAI